MEDIWQCICSLIYVEIDTPSYLKFHYELKFDSRWRLGTEKEILSIYKRTKLAVKIFHVRI